MFIMCRGLIIGARQEKVQTLRSGAFYSQYHDLLLPVGACMAELGMVAASWGTVLVSGSGVLVVGEVGGGFSKVRGFLCQNGWGKVCYPWQATCLLFLALNSSMKLKYTCTQGYVLSVFQQLSCPKLYVRQMPSKYFLNLCIRF